MQVLGLILLLLSIGSIAAPIAGVVIIYHEDLKQLLIPPELEDIVANTATSYQLPQYVSSTWNPETSTSILKFQFTNTFNFNLTLKEASGAVSCSLHDYPLGYATLQDQVNLLPNTTKIIMIIFTWTQEAEDHLITEHSDQQTIDITISNLILDVSGISIETPDQIQLTIPTLQ